MKTIAYYSLATSNDTNELSSRIEFHSLAMAGTDKPTIVPPAVSDKPLSEVLDEVQGTRRIVRTPSNPPSGRGSNTPTMPPSADEVAPPLPRGACKCQSCTAFQVEPEAVLRSLSVY